MIEYFRKKKNLKKKYNKSINHMKIMFIYNGH